MRQNDNKKLSTKKKSWIRMIHCRILEDFQRSHTTNLLKLFKRLEADRIHLYTLYEASITETPKQAKDATIKKGNCRQISLMNTAQKCSATSSKRNADIHHEDFPP